MGSQKQFRALESNIGGRRRKEIHSFIMSTDIMEPIQVLGTMNKVDQVSALRTLTF